VTATGCLRAGEQGTTFLLANAKWEPKPASGKDAPSRQDARPTQDRTTAGETLRLAGAPARLKLSDHVGHTISVTGTFAGEDRVVTPGIVLPDAPRGDTTSRKPEVGGKPPSRVFSVRTLTHVAAECK
jgi:hypothetical protein